MTFREVWNDGRIKLDLIRGVSTVMRHEKLQFFSLFLLIYSSHKIVTQPFGLGSLLFYFFTIKSMYNFLCFGRVIIHLPKLVWTLKLFLWITLYNKILTNDNLRNLRKKGWSGDILCIFCASSESDRPYFLSLSNYTGILVKSAYSSPSTNFS
jgi:zinc-binding in reverse transcriptase